MNFKINITIATYKKKFNCSHSNSSIYDHYLSSDDENEEDTLEEPLQEDEQDDIIDDIPSHTIWKGEN